MKNSEKYNGKKPSPAPILLAILLSFAGIGASVYAFNSYFDENPLPVDLIIRAGIGADSENEDSQPGNAEANLETELAAAAKALVLGRYDSAAQTYLAVLAEDSGNEAARSGILQVYEGQALQNVRNAEYDAAWNDIQKLETLDETRTIPLKAALTDAMITEASAKEDSSAKSLYEKVLSFDAENIDAYEGLVALALKADDYTEADRLIRECPDRTGTDRILRFRSKLPFALAGNLDFRQVSSAFDDSGYPVLLFDSAYNIIKENDEISVVREPMITEITEFSKTLPDENGDVIYTVTLHHKAHVTVMISAASEYARTGVGFLVSGNFPVFFDYYTGALIPLPQEDTAAETCVSWKDQDFYLYTNTWGNDATTDDGTFVLDGENYVRNVYYDYTQTATIKCPQDYDGLCLAFYDSSSVQDLFDLSDGAYTLVRAQEYQNLTVREGQSPETPDADGNPPDGASSGSSQSPGSTPSSGSSQTPGGSGATPASGSNPSQSAAPSSGETQSQEAEQSSEAAPSQDSAQPSEAAPSQDQAPSQDSAQPSETVPSSEQAQSQEATPSSEQAQPQESTDSYLDDVVRLVNLERANAGLGSVSATAELNAAAQARASEIIESFSHTRPDGSSCFTILDPYGVSYYTAGENIAAGQSSPESVMDAWMNSEGHRANILNGSFNHIGVGFIKVDGGYRYYWVQLFTD